MKTSALILDDHQSLKSSIEAGASQETLATGNTKILDKRKGESICLPYYRTRGRINSGSFNFPDISFFDRCNYFQDHVALIHEAQAGASQETLAKGNTKILDKRKGCSVCVPYYRTRRRIKTESFNFPDLSFFDRCNYFQAQVGDVLFSDCLASNLGSIGTTDYRNGSMREDGLYKLTENVCPLLRDNLIEFFDPGIEPKDDTRMHEGDSDNASAVTEVEYASLPDSVLSFSDKDYIVCILNTEDTIDDIPNSQLLDHSPESVLEEPSFHGDEQDVCHCEDDMESTSISHVDSIQIIGEKTICTLNTEDPEIPCNDYISFLIHPSPSVKPQIATDSIDLASAFTQSQMDSPDLFSGFVSAHPHVGNTLESISMDHNPSIPDHSSDSDLPLFPAIKDPEIPSLSIRPQTATYPVDPASSFTRSQMDGPDLSSEFDSAHQHVGSLLKSVSLDQNTSISDHNNSDSDIDLPCFPDIEALIRKLDFDYAQESWITPQVNRRKYKHSKMTINILDQASSKKAMSSLGAFAVFYSHHFNYYIKKTVVTVGRSTDDDEVDIDLRKESHAKMISRQQAIIKMETDGTFTLKNIGKGSILMKGISIAHGQVAALGSSCLIQIRGMNFMFEINDRYVRWYLDNIIKKTQGNFRSFEWAVSCG